MKAKLIYAFGLMAIFGCSGGEKKETSNAAEEQASEKQPQCTYAYNPSAKTEVLWVAYKYTEKTGVKGVFDSVEVRATGSGESVADVLNGAEMSITTSSVNSGDATRDPKIVESFFGALSNGATLSGKVTAVDGSNMSFTADIGMNGSVQAVSGTYSLNETKLELKLELTLTNWGAEGAIQSLNKVCEDLHKGTDGKSILWPDVTVFVTTDLSKNCL